MLHNKKVGFIRSDDRRYEKRQEKIKKKIRKILAIVKTEAIENDVIIVVPKYKKYNKLLNKIISTQINRYVEKINLMELIFENDMKFLENVISRKYISNEKYYIKNNIIKVFNYIFQINQTNINLENVYVLVNDYNKQNIELIKQLTEAFKTVNIITENIRRYKRLEDSYYKQGILITISNNKRKSLKNAKYIINIDFDKIKILMYNIYPNSVIINLSSNDIEVRKGFNGVLLNNLEIQVNEDEDCFIKEFYGNINKRVFLETLIKRNANKTEYIKKINQKFDVKIDKLIGVRGIIENNEFLGIKS